MRPNRVLRAWREGRQTIGGWLSTPSGHSAEVMANLGFDWLCIDMQHGAIDYADVLEMCRAISTTETTPFVRVPWNDPAMIMKVLDAGAYGVIVPLVNNREEAELAVWSCRYPPDGGRSSGPTRAAMYGGAGYQDEANDEIAVICMIETEEALENLDEILSTPGVDCAYIGPSDLAYAIGITPTGDNADPKHQETVLSILEACRRHGVAAGIHTGSLEYTVKWLQAGFDTAMLNNDVGFIRQAAGSQLAEARSTTGVANVHEP
ncbi:MAG: 2,4-dihydroxyhept-2-ene-1,7-dioic acid aldolase [Chloroflexi bacterium]|nr:2,4-dihydroxyhept-2-ene-1,7-dioic acid aldolase [Chloroflexota bacterium]